MATLANDNVGIGIWREKVIRIFVVLINFAFNSQVGTLCVKYFIRTDQGTYSQVTTSR